MNIELIVKFMPNFFFGQTEYPEVPRRGDAANDDFLFMRWSWDNMSHTPDGGIVMADRKLQGSLSDHNAEIESLKSQLAEQERAIEQLREDHTFRAAVIEGAADGICVCHDIPDPPLVKFTVWNQRMTEITGYTMDEINRRGWYQTMYPDPDLQARARTRMDQMREGNNLRFERWEITRADGEKREIAITTSVLVTREGAVHVLGLMHDFTERQRLEVEARHARTDELTGVKNRRGFREAAHLMLTFANKNGHAATLAYVDIGNLKAITDALGHAAGDEILAFVGQKLTDLLRATDIVGRLGGDEFAVVIIGMDAAKAKAFVGRLHADLAAGLSAQENKACVSLGAVTFRTAPADLDTALMATDARLYRAQARQRAGAVVHEELTDIVLS